MPKYKITNIKARMVFDSRGMPTLETEVYVNQKFAAAAIAPSGASKGKYEAIEKKDKKKNFFGNGVDDNISFVNTIIKEELMDKNVEDQEDIDKRLIQLDGTKNKSFLGSNTTTAVSMAVLRAAAVSNNIPLWTYLNMNGPKKLPMPEIQIIGGGAHAKGSIAIQDFMIIPNGANDFYEALHWSFQIYQVVGKKLFRNNKLFGVADEGGYWPKFDSIEKILKFLTEAIIESGFKPYRDISISLDIAASNFKKNNHYHISEKEAPIHISNLSLVTPDGKTTRVGFRYDEGVKVRYSKKTNEVI